jgi:hypothetical protein
MSIERPAAYWPTQWPQVLVGKHIEVNQSKDHNAFTKIVLQGSLSTATAAAGTVAFASEGVNLVIDGASYAASFPVRGFQSLTNPTWLDSFYQTLDSRPKLSDRIERILSQALGALISLLQTSFLLVIREDWSTQLHEHLGNYNPPADQPLIKSARLKSQDQEKKEEEAAAQPPGEASAPGTAKTTPPSVPRRETPSPKEPTPAAALTSAQPTYTVPPPPSSASLKSAMSTKSTASEEGVSVHAPEGALKPAAKKKKRVIILSKPPTDASPIHEEIQGQQQADKGKLDKELAEGKDAEEASPLLQQIKAQQQRQAIKGEEIAAKVAEDQKNKAATKPVSEQEKVMMEGFAKIKARRVASVHFIGYQEPYGNLASGKMSLRVLARAFSLPFPHNFSGTLGEYILEEFEKQKLPIEIFSTCDILDEDWETGTGVRITITKLEQDPATGKNTVVEVGLSWDKGLLKQQH